jgi:hypothetical protein
MRNTDRVAAWDRAVNAVLFLQPRSFGPEYRTLFPRDGAPRLDEIQWTAVVAYGAALVWLPVVARRRLRVPDGFADGVTILFVWYALVSMVVVNIAFELGENNRFRMETEPLAFVAASVLATAWLRRGRYKEGWEAARPAI